MAYYLKTCSSHNHWLQVSTSGYLYPVPESWRRLNGAGRSRTDASSIVRACGNSRVPVAACLSTICDRAFSSPVCVFGTHLHIHRRFVKVAWKCTFSRAVFRIIQHLVKCMRSHTLSFLITLSFNFLIYYPTDCSGIFLLRKITK